MEVTRGKRKEIGSSAGQQVPEVQKRARRTAATPADPATAKATARPRGRPATRKAPIQTQQDTECLPSVPEASSATVRARNTQYDQFQQALQQHEDNGDYFVVQHDVDGEVQAWRPVPAHFEQLRELSGLYEFPFETGTRFWAEAGDGQKYLAELKFVERSLAAAVAKKQKLEQIYKASKKADAKKSTSSSSKAQKIRSADHQTQRVAVRTPRDSPSTESQGMQKSPSLEDLSAQHIPNDDLDAGSLAVEREVSPLPSVAPKPSDKGIVAPSSGVRSTTSQNVTGSRFMPSSRMADITPAPVAPRDKAKLGRKTANNSKKDDSEFKWPYEIETGNVPLCPKLGGQKIYIDEAYLNMLSKAKMNKGALVRAVCSRLLLGPNFDYSGMRKYYEMREDARARGDTPPGICDFLGPHFMLNLQTFVSGPGYEMDTSGSWISKTLGAWKEEVFKKHKEAWKSGE